MAPPTSRLAACFLPLLLAVVALQPAVAQAEPPPEVGLRLGARGLGELWDDTAMHQVYRSNRFTASGVASYRVWRFVGVDLEVGYERQAGMSVNAQTLETGAKAANVELVPISAMVSASRDVGNLSLFAALGCAITPFDEESASETISGTKIGAALQVGARIDTKLVQPSWSSGGGARLQAVDFELFAGRRQHQLFGVGEGLDLSAWRFGAGLMARF